MFERFTGTARHVVVQAQADARRLGHNYIGCEHLLLAAAAAAEPASAVLRDQGVTPERVEAEILRTVGRGQAADPLGGLDRQALAFIGIDLDVVRARIEAAFGPDALTRALPAACRSRRPARGKGPLAGLTRRRRRRRARRDAAQPVGRSRRPYPVHAAREESPGTLAARGQGAAGQLHRRPAPHPGPARPQRRHGTGDPVGPRRVGHIAARRHPRPLPQGELIRGRRQAGGDMACTRQRHRLEVGQSPAELFPGADAELREYLAQVPLDGARADVQLGADLGVGVPITGEPGDLASCAVSSPAVLIVRLRTVSPVASSSRRAR